jgi:tetratricopeptide (TPR) repeat protein
MGVVYAATHPTLGDVALKVMLPQAFADPSALERFAREAQAVARLDHAGLARVLDAGREGATPYVAMRFVAGEPLDARLRRGPPSQEEAARLAEALALALGHAHQRGVLHRDVKPSNVIVDPTGAPVLVDFGLARVARADRLTATGELLGTPSYMAPEQATGAAPATVGPAADVYGLGATLYELLAGAPPFVGPSVMSVLEKVLVEAPAPPSRARPDLDPALERLVLACLEKDPAARPGIDALALALAAWRRGRARRERAGRRGRRARSWVALAGLSAVGVAGVGVAVLALHGGEPPPAQPPVSVAPLATNAPSATEAPPAPPPRSVPPPPPEEALQSANLTQARTLCDLALRRLALQDVDGAAGRIEQAAALAPECGDVWLARATLRRVTGELAGALDDVERARASLHPPEDEARLDMIHGALLYQLGRVVDSAPHLLRAYHALGDGVAPELCFSLGAALRAANRPTEAIAPLERVVASGRFGWRGHFNLAGALRSCGRREEAVEQYRRARAMNDYPGFLAHLHEASTLLALERPAEALVALEEGLTRVPEPPDVDGLKLMGTLALALVRTGAHAQGLEWAERALRAGTATLGALTARAEALQQLGRADEARAARDAARALELEEAGARPGAADDVLARCAEAQRRLEGGDPAGAEGLLAEAQRLAPHVAEVWIATGNLRQALGDLEGALVALERARTCSVPTDDPVQLDVLHGAVLCRLNRHVDALPLLERSYRALADPPPWLCLDLGIGLRGAGRAAEALEPLKRAAEAGLGWRAHFNLAGALRACARLEEALDEFRRGRAAPDYGGYYGHLREGETLLDLGRPAEALPVLEEGLALGGVIAAKDYQLLAAIAQGLVRTGDPARGLEVAAGALPLNDEWLRTHAARIEALLRLDRRDEARAALAAAPASKADDRDLTRLAAELDR